MSDRRLLYLNAFLRALATGMVGVLIGIHLAKRGFDPGETGIVVSLGLAGAAAAAMLVTLLGDRVGRRRMLILLALFGAGGGVVAALASSFTVMLAAAFLGMVNGMGRDRGAALILDQVILPATVSDTQRTASFAWYNVLQDAGHAIGGLAAGLPVLFLRLDGMDEVTALQYAVLVYAGLLGLSALAYARLSPAAE
ncbi:MAG: MFS transporter, partial [Nevskiales bacterium]